MNSSVMRDSETSVMSSSCLAMRVSSRSNGPAKLPSETENPDASAFGSASARASASATGLGGRATGDQFSRELTICRSGRVVGGKRRDGGTCDTGIRELHGASDDGLENLVSEGL